MPFAREAIKALQNSSLNANMQQHTESKIYQYMLGYSTYWKPILECFRFWSKIFLSSSSSNDEGDVSTSLKPFTRYFPTCMCCYNHLSVYTRPCKLPEKTDPSELKRGVSLGTRLRNWEQFRGFGEVHHCKCMCYSDFSIEDMHNILFERKMIN